MNLRPIWRREYGPLVAAIISLAGTASYLTVVVMAFDVKPLLLAAFAGLTIAVLLYWIRGEPTRQETIESDRADAGRTRSGRLNEPDRASGGGASRGRF